MNLLQLPLRSLLLLACLLALPDAAAQAQSVCLPAPRLLTLMPMGAQVGTTVEVVTGGEYLEGLDALLFSAPGISAEPKKDEAGQVIPNHYLVTVAPDCAPGIYDARVTSRLGLSTARAFHVAQFEEVVQAGNNRSVANAQAVPLNSICNGAVTAREVDYYSITAEAGQNLVIDCGTLNIDSKLKPVLIIADQDGQDLMVERRGGILHFAVSEAGTYLVKIHDLTFNGGPHYFYRLRIQNLQSDQQFSRFPPVRTVSSFSWPPLNLAGLPEQAEQDSTDNNAVMNITLPARISGSFYPAADVDRFQFSAKKEEVWWIEVASERLGLSTDSSIVVQRLEPNGEQTKLTDVLQLTDIPSPVKVSSNGYSYDGPPYNSGSTDAIGKLEIPEDGEYQLQLTDLFGGTRNDPNNRYELFIRKAEPDFALVTWPLHMELRNGDRNALSKPMALRGGAVMALEVMAFRRDGFDGPIELQFDNLPEGVKATGLTIPSGKSNGIVIIGAEENAPTGFSNARFFGTSTIDGQKVERNGYLATMAWPVSNAWSEIPCPKLVQDFPISVSTAEQAPLSLAATEQKVWEAKKGETLQIPLKQTRRCEFSGKVLTMKTFGNGFEKAAPFEVALDADTAEAKLDLAALKTEPGEYTIAFYGSAVAKYRYCPEELSQAETALEQIKQQQAQLNEQIEQQKQVLAAAAEQDQSAQQTQLDSLNTQKTELENAFKLAEKRVQDATRKSSPKDIVDIIVSEPIRIRVTPTEEIVQK
ncbi:MAG: serine protease [Planctomycetaceae bacterium]|nr:serine protease [Planctomycetaceae bacterium]